MRITLIAPILILFALIGCKKQEEVLVPNNTPPPDYTISNLTLKSYINRSYISLLGRKPIDTEVSAAMGILRAGNFSISNRNSFLDEVMSNDEYFQNLFDIGRSQFLDAVDTAEINENINIFILLSTDPNYQPLWPAINAEIAKMQLVMQIVPDLTNGSIDTREMHYRLIYNYIYDQLNMGTQNFVISCFQKCLFRYPTADELEKGELMVNGFPSQIFLETGKSKTDFIRIFLNSRDYAEGQVRDIFSRYLFREPSSEEMSSYAARYLSTGNYKDLQKLVLSTDEYAGI